MSRVQDILDTKGDTVFSLAPGDMVADALDLMARENIGAVVILDDSKLSGIFTERHYARNVFLKGRASPTTTLAEVMVRDVITVSPDESIEVCMALMSHNRIRHLPVIAENRIAGMVSIGDVMSRIIKDRRLDVEHLLEFISSYSSYMSR